MNDVKKYLSDAVEQIRLKALRIIEIEAVKSIKKNFESGGRPKWIPTKKRGKARGTKTLVISGRLSNVQAERNDADGSVTISPGPEAKAYAKIHQEGGTINMPARTLRFREKKYKTGSKRTVFASSRHKKIKMEKVSKPYTIKIPARPYLVIPQEDINRMIKLINNV